MDWQKRFREKMAELDENNPSSGQINYVRDILKNNNGIDLDFNRKVKKMMRDQLTECPRYVNNENPYIGVF